MPFQIKQYIFISLVVSIWINASEVFRYFVFVMPRVKSFFVGKAGVAEMDWIIFSIWGFWDSLLTALLVFLFWLYARSFGNNWRSIFVSGSIAWLFVFVIFWVATANMGLAEWSILWITLPLSWIEMVVGTAIAAHLYRQKVAFS